MNKIKWNNETRKISELKPAKYNPRSLNEKQENDLMTSLEKFELAEPIIINKNNVIIGGHQRINILKKKGINIIEINNNWANNKKAVILLVKIQARYKLFHKAILILNNI